MNFLALIVGLIVERTLTRLFHLREFRWLDPLFDGVSVRLGRAHPVAAGALLALLALLLVAPVAALQIYLARGWLLIVYFAFAVLVLLFSLGPRDLNREVEDYSAAVEAGQAADVDRVAKELIEKDADADLQNRSREIERAIYVQGNNRVFGVVFWFFALGPVGAWLFRVLDLMRRRAMYRLASVAAGPDPALVAAQSLQGLMAWIPARLMAGAFALAGSFQGAVSAWTHGNAAADAGGSRRFYQTTEELIGRVGQGARGPVTDAHDHPSQAARVARAAIGLVQRTLLVWFVVIAILTLNERLL